METMVDLSNRELIINVDATPNDDYPLRILRAHRQNYRFVWSSSSEKVDEENPLVALLNEANEKRAAILDKAISILERQMFLPQEIVTTGGNYP